MAAWVGLDGKLEELRGLVTMGGGPRLMDLSMSDFFDVVWAHIVTPPAMADAHDWREVMYVWFYLGCEPQYVNVYDPKTRKHTRKLAPRESYGKGANAVEAGKVARGADAQMKRLRERHEANREVREAKRQQMAADRAERDPRGKRS